MSLETSGSDDDLKQQRELFLDHRIRRLIYRWSIRLGAVGLIVFFGFPVYWIAQNSFKATAAIIEGVSFYPTAETFSLEPYSVLFEGALATYFTNSIIVTVMTIAVVVSVSLVSGYGLARFRFPCRLNFARVLLLGYMFSPIVISLPLYLIWDRLGLLNSYTGLTIIISTIALPFSVWLMWKYVNTIPRAMEESAMIAGASRFRVFIDIIVPQTLPAIMAVALFAFAISWNDFTIAKILNPANDMTTLPPGLLRLVKEGYEFPINQMMAASLVMSIPPLLFAYFFQSYLLKGFEKL